MSQSSLTQCCVDVYTDELCLRIIQITADKFVRVSVARFRCWTMAVEKTVLPFVCARYGVGHYCRCTMKEN